MYYKGRYLPRSYKKAAYLFKKSAVQGNSYAEFGLGKLYYSGLNFPQNYSKAAYWWKKSAAKGNSMAEYYLGCLYYNGEGVSRNILNALYWLKMSAFQGNTLANKYLEKIGQYSNYGQNKNKLSGFKKNAGLSSNLGSSYYNNQGFPAGHFKVLYHRKNISFMRRIWIIENILNEIGYVFIKVIFWFSLLVYTEIIIIFFIIRIRRKETIKKSNPELYSKIQEIAESVGIKKEVKVYMLKSSSPNMFVTLSILPKIYVKGPIISLLNEEELNVVSAHEIGHLKYRLRRVIELITILAIVTILNVAIILNKFFWPIFSFSLAVLLFANLTLIMYISRKHEYAADAFAITVTKNPEAMRLALIKLRNYNNMRLSKHRFKRILLKIFNNIFAMFGLWATHPTLKERFRSFDQVKNKINEEDLKQQRSRLN